MFTVNCSSMRIIVADNNYLVRQGLVSIITEIFRDADIIVLNTVSEMLKIQVRDVDLLIIDPDSFHLTDIVELSIFSKRNPGSSIMVITQNKHYRFVQKIVNSGIRNFIFKDTDAETFSKSLNSAIRREQYYDQQVNDILNMKILQDNVIAELTKTEKEIVRLIAQGLTTKEIAAKKFLSHHTIITHRKNIFKKVGIKNISELLMYAVNEGIIDTTEYFI